jgi:hypothetical protein
MIARAQRQRIFGHYGWALTLQPGIVWAARERVLLFVLASVPLAEAWRNPADRERFRIGAGTILAFGR